MAGRATRRASGRCPIPSPALPRARRGRRRRGRAGPRVRSDRHSAAPPRHCAQPNIFGDSFPKHQRGIAWFGPRPRGPAARARRSPRRRAGPTCGRAGARAAPQSAPPPPAAAPRALSKATPGRRRACAMDTIALWINRAVVKISQEMLDSKADNSARVGRRVLTMSPNATACWPASRSTGLSRVARSKR